MKVIGLVGGRGVGKSCVADVVVEVTENSYCREFYSPVRRFLLAAFGNADLVVATRELFGLTFEQIGGARSVMWLIRFGWRLLRNYMITLRV
ncbi:MULTISPECIES: hypothetical protein [unclassified Neptuniibacter]|uniref:hypothetical protein n=1 Tax=unclassified Neptuniibacter TaxID=2630693 RepID=UPI000C5EE7F7|nr:MULTISPECIES: hypothetical protein [unclassified Neptuniibacter]MAY42404.1 hypothetical protein [Oceanospirillaceae bacterium]|tara:strand:- start:26426 stop:26701 length:276 start_codon:yes stop_codon:yes gene_type:complete